MTRRELAQCVAASMLVPSGGLLKAFRIPEVGVDAFAAELGQRTADLTGRIALARTEAPEGFIKRGVLLVEGRELAMHHVVVDHSRPGHWGAAGMCGVRNLAGLAEMLRHHAKPGHALIFTVLPLPIAGLGVVGSRANTTHGIPIRRLVTIEHRLILDTYDVRYAVADLRSDWTDARLCYEPFPSSKKR